jgi:hypothetical protein
VTELTSDAVKTELTGEDHCQLLMSDYLVAACYGDDN